MSLHCALHVARAHFLHRSPRSNTGCWGEERDQAIAATLWADGLTYGLCEACEAGRPLITSPPISRSLPLGALKVLGLIARDRHAELEAIGRERSIMHGIGGRFGLELTEF